ncbi:dynamin family protein [Actinomadura chibensis]|uniref:Dynamin N-terminal domain-containing protein n=1 Tax=Actinomadura chibensis TaxID=392828 RepID=A0A5D0NN92_9ACTN|nr:dynamin family protein [Actinomadura chibensis]TYB45709.1 hypothetical protein FXF69_20065 [Actinomadura chibensis]
MAVVPRHPLTDDVLKLTERITSLCVRTGALEDSALLRGQTASAAHPGSTVVVVGEKKRGKSSLINALLDRPDLLPVDADVATSVHLSVGYGPKDLAWVLGEDARQIPFAEIAEYGAVDPDTGEERHPEVTGVEIQLPADLLAGGLGLIDTPGVGGLLAGHSAITLAALERADALLFVVNGSMELSRSELEFLTRASERTGTVLFALTKIDLHPHWRTTLDRDLELLARHAPRFMDAPWFPVSSRYKSDADRAAESDPEFAAGLRDRSRYDALSTELRDRTLQRIQAGRLGGLLDTGAAALDRLDGRQRDLARSLSKDGALDGEIRRRQQELIVLQSRDAAWRGRLGERVGALERDLRARTEERLNTLRDTAHDAVRAGGKDVQTEVPRDLADGIRGLGMELENLLYDRASAIVDGLAEEFGVHGVAVVPSQLGGFTSSTSAESEGHAETGEPAAAESAGADPALEIEPREDDEAAEAERAEQIQWLRDTARKGAKPAGAALGNAAAGVGGFVRRHPKAGPLAVIGVAAGAVTLVTLGVRRYFKGRGRKALEAYVDQVIAQQRSALPPALQDALRQVLTDLERAASDRLAERQLRLHEELAEAQANRAESEAVLAPRREEARRRLDEIAALRGDAESLRRLLRDQRTGEGGSPEG